jgi:glycosyltransferase involved in cell wall biosynthesis
MDKGVIGMVRGLLRLRKAVKLFRSDVVHSHMLHANLLTRLLRLTVSMPRLISTVPAKVETRSRLLRFGYRLTNGLADLTTFVSAEAAEAYIEQGLVMRPHVLPVHNGIDVDRFSPQPDARCRVRAGFGIDSDTHLLIAIGRLVEEKVYPNLIRAFAQLGEKESSTILLIVGVGPLFHELEAACISHGVAERVVFAGMRSDIPELLSAADILVLASASEGFGLVVAEAMACEVVVVATDCGGVKEVVGDAGLLVPPKNDAALATCILQALHMPESERRVMGRAARHRIQNHYSMDRVVDRWEQLYRGDQGQ